MLRSEPEQDGLQMAIPDFEIETLARCLLPQIQAYFESPEGRTEFERWKAEHTQTVE